MPSDGYVVDTQLPKLVEGLPQALTQLSLYSLNPSGHVSFGLDMLR